MLIGTFTAAITLFGLRAAFVSRVAPGAQMLTLLGPVGRYADGPEPPTSTRSGPVIGAVG